MVTNLWETIGCAFCDFMSSFKTHGVAWIMSIGPKLDCSL